jgi:Ca-activated chloride channel homolog
MPDEIDFYELLGLSKDATPEEIRRSFHDSARRLHPDVNKGPGETELFLQVQDAFEVLSDPQKRSVYDDQLNRASASSQPVTLSTLYSRSVLPQLGEAQLVYSLLKFSPSSEIALPSNPPLNVCLVLDRSTSMQGDRMDTVKSAAIELMRQLRPVDMLSIVTFGDRAEVLLPANSRLSREEVETQIRLIRTGGGTEIFRGLEAGYQELRRNLHKTNINHMILLTDGRTYGDETASLHLASQAGKQGIRITSLGIGSEWNDTFLDELTSRTGGISQYVSKPGDLRHFLKEKFIDLNHVYVNQAVLQIETGQWAALNYAYRLHPDPAPLPNPSPLQLGGISKNDSLSILLEFIVLPVPEEYTSVSLAKGIVQLEIPSLPNPSFRLAVNLNRPVGLPPKEQPPSSIVQALSQITLYRLQERAHKEVLEGKVDDASRHLQRLATHLLTRGQRDLAYTALMEAEKIFNTHSFSDEGGKQIKYGTRALLLPARTTESE